MHDGTSVVLGAGPVGRTLVDQLRDTGADVRVVTRSGRAAVPDGAEVTAPSYRDG